MAYKKQNSVNCIIIKMQLLAANMMIESKELVCTQIGKTKYALVTYHTVPGKKRASEKKGFKEEPGGINDQELEKLESKNFF